MSCTKNQPKVDTEVKKDIETFKKTNLNHAETKDSTQVLPSTEEIKEERKELQKRESIEKFNKHDLKPAKTEEKCVLPSVQDLNQEKTLHHIEEFDKGSLKPAETVVKDQLPTKEVIAEEKRASKTS